MELREEGKGKGGLIIASWDKNVLVGILQTGTVPFEWAMGFRNLQIPGQVLPASGLPFDHGRNKLCMAALECGADFIFFLDSDVIPPPDAIPRLIAHNLPIVSGVYHRRSTPHGKPVMIRVRNSRSDWITEYKKNSLIGFTEEDRVDFVGAGCLLIRRDVLEKMQPCAPGYHWFQWRVNLQQGVDIPAGFPSLSEDFTFCWEARKQNENWKTIVDTSIQCEHLGVATARKDSMVPLN